MTAHVACLRGAARYVPHGPEPLRLPCASTAVPVPADACGPQSHPTTYIHIAENSMSKGMDSKKSEKKKPTKTLKEKRAAKQEKKKSQ